MKRFFFILSILIVTQVDAQLTVSQTNINFGRLDGRQTSSITVPILNQSKDTLTCTQFIPGSSNGVCRFPDQMESYEFDEIRSTFGYYEKSEKVRMKLVFETNNDRFALRIKGKLENSADGQSCYRFDQKKRKKHSGGKFYTTSSNSDVIRVYDRNDKNTLYASDPEKVPFAHLILLVDASGSMAKDEKLDLMKEYISSIILELRPTDYISILRYSEGGDVIANHISCRNRDSILNIVSDIQPGGFTNGKAGISDALEVSRTYQEDRYTNHIIMFTDGAFNLGEETDRIGIFLNDKQKESPFRFSVYCIDDGENSTDMRKLARSGNGYFVNLDEDFEKKKVRNNLLIRQLSL